MLRKNTFLLSMVVFTLVGSCQNYLDVKPNKSWVVPVSLQDLQAILDDNSDNMNRWRTPVFLEVGADDYYLTESDWLSVSPASHRNVYMWAAEIYEGDVSASSVSSWSYPYGTIYRCNYVLEALDELEDNEKLFQMHANVKGSALFYRSWAFFQLAQLFCKQYDKLTAHNDLGIPIKLESDINIKSSRSSVSVTYQQILNDLKASLILLPDLPEVKTRPSKWATYAMLAKVYLQMGEYDSAYYYADSCLAIKDNLIDFNNLDLNRSQTFDPYNDEVIFHSVMVASAALSEARVNVDSTLYRSYGENDLRKNAYFSKTNNRINFKGSYSGMFINPFGGIAIDEIYLIRAECAVRLGMLSQANQDLNILLTNRMLRGSWEFRVVNDGDELLGIILDERRKELPFRGIRWADLRRLNREAQFEKLLIRRMGNSEWVLPPNDNRYVLPIPDEVVAMNQMEQNSR